MKAARGGTPREPTRVLLVAGSRIVAQLLSAALDREQDLQCVGVAEDAATAVLEAVRLQPDVVLGVGLHLEVDDWSAALVALSQACPAGQVVLLPSPGSGRSLEPAPYPRARIVSAPETDLAALFAAVRDASGEVGPARQVQRVGDTDSPEVRADPLTPADLTLLRLVAAGYDSEAAARELQISPGFVRQRLRRICTDLGVESPTQAVAHAVTTRLLTLHPRE